MPTLWGIRFYGVFCQTQPAEIFFSVSPLRLGGALYRRRGEEKHITAAATDRGRRGGGAGKHCFIRRAGPILGPVFVGRLSAQESWENKCVSFFPSLRKFLNPQSTEEAEIFLKYKSQKNVISQTISPSFGEGDHDYNFS